MTYFVPDTAYDELGRGTLPEAWQSVMPFFESRSDNALSPEQIRSQMRVRNLDIQRPWPLDPIPYVMSNADWQVLAQGLSQRALLLNHILGDLYQQRSLLAAGGLPPALLFGNAKYLLPAVDYRPPKRNFLSLVGFDVARTIDGSFRVLADWTEAPQGLGMCLENRLLTTQALPMLFQQHGTERLRDFLSSFAAQLKEPIHADQTGETVILSPGPTDPSYFEHVYLGQYFGFHVVEGADLTVRGNALQLKTLEGLKPVNTVWRYTAGACSDPLYLDDNSTVGAPGVINVARSAFVKYANAIGTGVLENDAFMSFLPGLSHRFLGEDLHLPSVATWWCGQIEAAQQAQAHSEQLSFQQAFHRADMMTSSNAAYTASGNAPDRFDYTVVAREPTSLSYSPYLTEDGQIAAGATTLRLFVAHIQGEYHILPGGVAKVSTEQGELTKDIWVTQPPTMNMRPTSAETTFIRRTDRDLPSRTADDLFWLGRYIERCDGAVRAFRLMLTHVAEHGIDDRSEAMQLISKVARDLHLVPASTMLDATQNETALADLLLNPDHTYGITKLISNIYHLASQVRERLSPDAWRIFGAIYNEPIPLAQPAAILAYLDRLMERISALNGQIQENMTRGYGWRLLELGRGLERGYFSLSTLSELNSRDASPMKLHLLLELCDSAITYRARYQTLPRLDQVLHLLLLDEANPRSVVFQIQRLSRVMQDMPLDQSSEGLSESQRLLLSAYHELTLAEPAKMAGVVSKAGNRTQLRRVLKRLETTLATLSQRITETYFAHISGAGRAR